MEPVIDLKDLLKHEIMDLHSAEQQIIDALPAMIEKANNGKLKTALKDHLKVTEEQKKRLEELQQTLRENGENEEQGQSSEKRGFFSRLFGGEEKCKGMEGLIAEGKKLMGEEMSPEASDAAIIAAAQKIEHYEISGYGTARAYARELNLGEVANKLEQTLNEEYQADDLLTELAVGKINIDAEFATDAEDGGGRKSGQAQQGGRSDSRRSANGRDSGDKASRSNGRGGSAKSQSGGNGTTSGRNASASKSASKPSSSKPASKASSSKSASKSLSSKSSSSKSSRGGSSSSGRTSSSNRRGAASKGASKSKGSSKLSGGSSRSSGGSSKSSSSNKKSVSKGSSRSGRRR